RVAEQLWFRSGYAQKVTERLPAQASSGRYVAQGMHAQTRSLERNFAMREIQSPDPTWSVEKKLTGSEFADIRPFLEKVLNQAGRAGLRRDEETRKFVTSSIAAMERFDTLTIEREIGRPGIKLRISFTREPDRHYTMHITASAKAIQSLCQPRLASPAP